MNHLTLVCDNSVAIGLVDIRCTDSEILDVNAVSIKTTKKGVIFIFCLPVCTCEFAFGMALTFDMLRIRLGISKTAMLTHEKEKKKIATRLGPSDWIVFISSFNVDFHW